MANLNYIHPRNYADISRYGIYYQIVDYSTNETYLESPNSIKIDSENSIYHTVEVSEENRLDIISNKYYGRPDYFWVIAMANNIVDPMIVVKGSILKIPPFESLFNDGGPLIRRG